MNWFDYWHTFTIFIVCIPYGVLIKNNRTEIINFIDKFSTQKLRKKVTEFFMTENIIVIVFLILGLWYSDAAVNKTYDYELIKDIVVSLLGFSGLILTFMLGNLLSNKSNLQKNFNELKATIVIEVAKGRFNFAEKDKEINNLKEDYQKSIKQNTEYIGETFLWGFITIFCFIMSLFGLIIKPYDQAITHSISFLVFAGVFGGFGVMLKTFNKYSRTLQYDFSRI